ncbi:Serine/threonine-protein phosphatase 5 [Hypsizygus marmoreus]|uniref:Serine/threonine-protein phosphatase 5 n=1 Tax=Hypsizygus marmoreus TaxID=39966 RepID=A0A369JMH9_HYPMA|nr:Serine/threonine-protein phosphatase 5 [Hypsizygus marmoreus]
MSTSQQSLESTENTLELQENAQENADTDSVNVVQVAVNVIHPPTPEERAKNREEALAERESKRLQRWQKNHAQAEELSKAGDVLLENKDFAGACACYIDATNLWSSNSTYYLKLTSAYIKCEIYVEAAHAATRALSFDPKSLEARYLRGVARLEQGLLAAAKTDFETVLKQEPTHADAQKSLATVLKLIEAGTKLGTHVISDPPSAPGEETRDVDFDFPHYDDEKLELASLSDSSDCNHVGNGIPCRFYNHDGCARGSDCIFSHAPDEKSVRDNLGKNVCIYFLLSSCKFGDLKCIYSHTKANLPTTQGWWNDEARIAKVKSVVEMAEKKAKERRALDMLLYKLEASKARKAKAAKKKAASAKEPHAASASEKEEAQPSVADRKKPTTQRKTREKKVAQKHADLSEDSTDDQNEERIANGGFTDYELNELASQGVKPWDDDAQAVLAVLSY